MIKSININRQTMVRSIGTAILCVALAISLVWPTPSRAQNYTVAELQNLLNQILAQLNNMPGGSTVGVCPFTWTRSLGQGATGSDVMRLQRFLNSSPDTALAVSGVGSAGMETQYYGPLTAAAVSKFQVKYRSQVLTPLGLVNPTGYFGPSSMAQANRLCAGSVVVPPSDTSEVLRGGAGSLSDSRLIAGITNEEVGEGENDVEVFGLELRPQGSDIEIIAVTLDFDAVGHSANRLNRHADDVSIHVNGKEYATIDADEFTSRNGMRKSITLDRGAIIRQGKTGELVVMVSGINNLDSSRVGDRFEVRVDSVRFRDAQGAIVTENSMDNLSRTFSFVEFAESTGLGFVVRNGDSAVNNARVIQVSSNSRTRDEAVLSFVVDTKGESDLMIDELRVNATTTGGTLDDIVSAAYLYMDGKRVGSRSITSASEQIVFNNLDLRLDAGNDYDFEVRVDIRQADGVNYASGATIDMDVTTTDRNAWVVEDERGDNVSNANRRGSASSDAHTLATEGVTVSLVSTQTKEVYNSSNSSASYGEFRMIIDVNAIGGTVYVAESATRDNSPSSAHGATYYFESGSGGEYASGNSSASFSRISGGSVENGFVRINEGQTARFELVTTLDPTDFGQYRTQLVSVGWNDTAATPDAYTSVMPTVNYRTSLQTISD